jgi:hypothetical protein
MKPGSLTTIPSDPGSLSTPSLSHLSSVHQTATACRTSRKWRQDWVEREHGSPRRPSSLWRIDVSADAMSDDFVAALPSKH